MREALNEITFDQRPKGGKNGQIIWGVVFTAVGKRKGIGVVGGLAYRMGEKRSRE